MIKRCLFPAAGYGTRFLPATKAMPKEMLPILTKPLIQYGVEEAYEAGCDIMATITGRGKRAITDHFDISYELEHQIKGTSKEELLTEIRSLIDNCTFTYTRQNEMKGLGDAIYKGKVLVGNSAPFAVILADDLCYNPEGDGVLTQMVKLYEKYKCSIVAIMEVPKENVSSYGVISGKEIEDGIFMVDNMVEKPDADKAPSNLAIIGRYILTPDIFDLIKDTKPGKNGEIQITDALLTQAKKGMVLGYKFKGKRFDCGSLDGFVEATNYFYDMQKKKK
jgi:UTP--glucose-1-phosphate uridylyltransferase